MTLFRSLALGAMLVAGAACAKAAALWADSVMEAARGVAAYFMRTCPDVGADSHVGGKRRNSRIWTRGVFYEGLLNIYREEQRPEWLDYALSWGEFHRWYSCTDSQARHADFQCCGQAYLQLYMLDTTAVERMSHIKMRIDAMMATDRVDDWYWVDAIQMAMPIFAMLGTITGDGHTGSACTTCICTRATGRAATGAEAAARCSTRPPGCGTATTSTTRHTQTLWRPTRTAIGAGATDGCTWRWPA